MMVVLAAGHLTNDNLAGLGMDILSVTSYTPVAGRYYQWLGVQTTRLYVGAGRHRASID